MQFVHYFHLISILKYNFIFFCVHFSGRNVRLFNTKCYVFEKKIFLLCCWLNCKEDKSEFILHKNERFFVVTQYNTNRKVIEKIFGKNVK